jgi:hypothetical protein
MDMLYVGSQMISPCFDFLAALSTSLLFSTVSNSSYLVSSCFDQMLYFLKVSIAQYRSVSLSIVEAFIARANSCKGEVAVDHRNR